MTPEQIVTALDALGEDLVVHCNGERAWVAFRGVEIANGTALEGVMGRGQTINAAIQDLWDKIRSLPADRWLVLGAHSDNRRAVRWNGFMWAPYIEPRSAA
jgi:hypothetical protein